MILVLNAGSSSIKYRLFAADTWAVRGGGTIERIGEGGSDAPPDHRTALLLLMKRLNLSEGQALTGIGHRVVHGGEAFRSAVRVDEIVIQAIREAIPLAPLHNPPNLLGIEICRDLWPEVPQVAVFDTAFHHTIPPRAYRYALPEYCYRELKIRRYGFHGSSFAYVSRRAAAYLGLPLDTLNAIVLHLGNGASMAAIAGGQSVDTSMGMTPVAGLMMGTRCGDLDPGVLLYLLAQGYSSTELDRLLNRDSGLKGVAHSNDMRDILSRVEQGNDEARLAIDLYLYRIRFYLGGYLAILGRVDALIFTGGIGEHAAFIRAGVCENLASLGIGLDESANRRVDQGIAELQSAESRVKILVIPTDEELEIAQQTANLLVSVKI